MTASALFGALACGLSFALSAMAGAIDWPQSTEILQGELIELQVTGPDLTAVEGSRGKERLLFYPAGTSSFAALVGADVEAKPGMSKILLKAKSQSGAEHRGELWLTVKAKSFRTESFNVPPSFDKMTPEALVEIRREQAEFKQAFESSAPERLWDGPFIRPVPHDASASSFGSRRVINGARRAPHSGTDLSAPEGTEVVAANHGRVALFGNFFFAGGSVVLDHGGGLFTMYFHLSEIRVDKDASVRRGDILGLSGATGRVTGAHLHWGARLADARVEPFELVRKIAHSHGRAQAQ